jgi:exopolysaccharide biosynthesis polyprenyl glycosylphosphotransferase
MLRAGAVLRRGRGGGFRQPLSPASSADLDFSPVWEGMRGVQDQPGLARDTALRRKLGLADVLAAFAALGLAVLVVGAGHESLRWTVLLVAPFVLLSAKAIGLYDRDQHVLRKSTIDELPSIVYLSVLYALAVWLTEGILLHGYMGRPEVFALAVTSFALLTGGRTLARAVNSGMTEPERCLIVGDATDAARVASKLASAPGVKASVAGRISLSDSESPHPAASGASDQAVGPGLLPRLLHDERIERVIIAPGGHDQDEVLHVIRLIKAMNVKVSVLPRLLEVVGSSSTFEDVDGLPLLGVRHYGVSRSSQALKRVMDIVGATAGLVVLAPFLAALALAIKLDSRGPVFFRQRRIGRCGRVFAMVKFRSMVAEADAIKPALHERNEVEGGLFKIADDPRITRVGHFLRRTSLDELPQLLNVLGGSMSLVGPRPLVESEDALIEGWQRRRLAVKPGMTGMWQIFGSSRIPMPEMVKIDYLYGANWSLWLDVKILLRTVPYILRRRGL